MSYLQITISTPSRAQPFQKSLGEAESKVVRTLAGGNASSIANAVMKMSEVKDELFKYFLTLINMECTELCRKGTRFRNIPVDKIATFRWEDFKEEMDSKSPLLLKILTTAATRVDHRYPHASNTAKYPGIITAAAVLLKQRNREMCAIPSVVSLMMYAGHCEKQVIFITPAYK